MKKLKSILLLLIILPSLLFFTACGGDNNNNGGNNSAITYTVKFIVDGDVYSKKSVESGGKVPKPENPTKNLYLFAGWYNGETEWNFETDVVSGDLTLTAKFDKADKVGDDYVKLNNFEIKKDENGEEYRYRAVSNKKTRYNFNDDIDVGTKNKWFVSLDIHGREKIESKMTDLEVGDNEFFLIVENDKNEIKQYILVIHRRFMFNVAFNTNGGGTVEPQEVEEDSLVNVPTETPSKAGYEFIGWDYNLELPVKNNLLINAKYRPINYTATFKVDGNVFTTRTFTIENNKIKDMPEVPNKIGYTGKWGNYTIKAQDIEINAIYTPIKYTATFKAEEVIVTTRTFTVEDTEIANLPSVPNKTGYTGKWESYIIQAEDIEINAVYTPIVYTAIFKMNGETIATRPFTVEDTEIKNLPAVPTKAGYTGEWENYTIKANDIEIKAKLITYTATFKMNGETIATRPFTVEDTEIANLPAVPTKAGYTGEWEDYTIKANDIEIKAKLITYTATFKMNGETIATRPFTVEDEEIKNLPAVPTKAGYTGEWEDYTIKANDLEIKAELINYTATFKADGNVVTTRPFTVEDAEIANFPIVPTKAGYTEKWEDYTIKAENITINAVYTIINYTITFKNYDGTILSEKTDYHYGDVVTTPKTPSKPSDNIYNYIFNGYDSEVTLVTGNKEYTATFKEEYRDYTITYHNVYSAVNNNKKTYNYNTSTFSLSDLSLKNEEFLGWYSDENLTIPADIKIEKGSYGNLEFYAKWNLMYYKVTYILPIDVENSNLTSYTRLTPLTTISNVEIDGNNFLGWYTSDTFEENTKITKIAGGMTGDLTLYAKIEAIGLVFKENSGKMTVTDYTGTASIVIVPSYHNGKMVTSIGSSAFYECSSLTSIEMPASVTSIGSSAFSRCSSLTNVYYKGTLEQWCNIGFSNSSSNPMYYAEHFYIKDGNGEYKELTEIEIPEGVTKIKAYTFYNIKSLTKVTIPSSVTSIGSYAFYDCDGLTSIIIPSSVTSIGEDAFFSCSSLTNVYYKGTLEQWCNIGFSNSSSNPMYYAEHFYIKDGNGEYKELTEIEIPEGVTKIKAYTFYNIKSLTKVTIPSSVTSIGKSAFSSCSSLTSVTFGESSKLTSIGEDAFYNCRSLTSVTFGESSKLTSIGYEAFYECSSLTSIEMPASVTSIGSSAFSYCSSLTNVYYKGTLEQWCNIGFSNSSSNPMYYAEHFYIKDGNGEYKELTGELEIPEGITEIKDYTFYGFEYITKVTISSSVTSIGESAFRYCNSLTSVYYKGTLEQWCNIGFSNSYSNPMEYAKNFYIKDENGEYKELTGELEIPEGITEIKDYTFYGFEYITKVTIPSSVTSIGSAAFWYCSSLTSVIFGEDSQLESIDEYAFNGCISLIYNIYDNAKYLGNSKNPYLVLIRAINTDITSCTIHSDTKVIGSDAFSSCSSLTSIVIPSSVTSIGSSAFSNCSSLTSIIIPSSVTIIGSFAFWYCNSLTTVYYGGTSSDWSKISIGFNNSNLTYATRYYYSETQPTTTGNYWNYVDGKPTIW